MIYYNNYWFHKFRNRRWNIDKIIGNNNCNKKLEIQLI